MAISRYQNDGTTGGAAQSARAVMKIRDAMKTSSITYKTIVLKEGERLDRIAGQVYGDGRLWWVIAAASNIGWWMQVPPGTTIRVPTDMGEIMGLL